MFSKTVNLRDQLVKARCKLHDAKILASVSAILDDNEMQREKIRKKLHSGSTAKSNLLQFGSLETDRIFHINHIRKVCIDYRLRFLDSNMFKHEFPEEAVTQIRALEKRHQTQLGGFRLIAPTKAFHLQNYNDPLLFIPIGNDYYYLVHQWGNDLKASRKWLVWPFRNVGTFTLLCLAVSIFVTLLFPLNKLGEHIRMATIIVFLFAFKSVFAVLMYGFFMGGRKFNAQMWNSKYYNN
jgi:ABC-type multidrug transport system fused ATPase/permease subunit